MRESISPFDPSEEFFTPDWRCLLELSNTLADPQASIARARVSPRQRISNPGKIDLIFLCVCTPRFAQEAYEDLA